ncbi:MAG: efflux RND transporter periplasmic adaptor subunit [Proteobacteria bacterium]|nr:efflux RND transporter periplasmic adaptor subunit [Pseudomonadota bacterium]
MSKPQLSERRSRVGLMVMLAPAVAAGVFAIRYFADHDHPLSARTAPPVPVDTAVAVRRNVPVYLTGIGTVQALNTVTIRTQVQGQLEKVLFTEGQTVKKGDLLAVVDPRPFQATLDQAVAKIQEDKADLANAKVVLSRDENLANQDYATQQALDNQRSLVAELEAQIAQDVAAKEAAAVQLSYTQITAPLTGRTGIRLVDAGNIVHPTDTTGLVVITQTQPISVISTLPEDDLENVRQALRQGPVTVTAFTRDGTVNLGSGTLSLIDNEIDQASGTMRLKSTFPNSEEKLWPGQYVEVRLEQKLVENTVTIPAAALQRGQQGFFVYVVNADDVVEPRNIKTGQIASGTAIVESGLSPGDRVVTSGSYQLDAGVKVKVEAANAANPTSAPGQ